MTRAALAVLALAGFVLGGAAAAQQNVRMYNTAKVKLARGEQIVGGTVTSPDPDIYCAMANAGFDWNEMDALCSLTDGVFAGAVPPYPPGASPMTQPA